MSSAVSAKYGEVTDRRSGWSCVLRRCGYLLMNVPTQDSRSVFATASLTFWTSCLTQEQLFFFTNEMELILSFFVCLSSSSPFLSPHQSWLSGSMWRSIWTATSSSGSTPYVTSPPSWAGAVPGCAAPSTSTRWSATCTHCWLTAHAWG